MARLVKDEALSVLHPEHGTKPRVWYKNLHRYTEAFVGGTVARQVDGLTDCVEGVKVRLTKDGRTVAETVSDAFGDFKIDRLPVDSGAYRLEVSGASKPIDVTVGESVYVGTVMV
jgi:hypothetical protein